MDKRFEGTDTYVATEDLMISPAAVFLAGAGIAAASLVLARLVPDRPGPDAVAVFFRPPAVPAE